jgi:hypothetical protein
MATHEEVKTTISQWFQERLRGGPIAHNTPAFNQAQAAYHDLVNRVDTLFGAEPSTPPELAAKTEPEIPAEEAEIHEQE